MNAAGFSLSGGLKNYIKVVCIWCPVVTVLFTFGFGTFDHLVAQMSISLIIATTVATCCFFGSWTFRFLYNRYRQNRGWGPKEEGPLWGVLTSYPFLLPGLYFGFLFAARFSSVIGYPFSCPKFNDYSSGVIFGILVSGLFSLFEVIRDAKEAKGAAERRYQALENEKLKAQVSALSAQMNPHLLFNALNTIAATVATDPSTAEDMIVKLSELYRGILKSAKGDMHSLESELLLCRSYLDIEKRRFGSRINYAIQIESSIDPSRIEIPVLLIQPLVENAVKHGLAPKREGGTITIDVRHRRSHVIIRVIDDGVGPGKSKAGSGTALKNCESRVRLKYGSDSDFDFGRNERNETTASIQLPIGTTSHDSNCFG